MAGNQSPASPRPKCHRKSPSPAARSPFFLSATRMTSRCLAATASVSTPPPADRSNSGWCRARFTPLLWASGPTNSAGVSYLSLRTTLRAHGRRRTYAIEKGRDPRPLLAFPWNQFPLGIFAFLLSLRRRLPRPCRGGQFFFVFFLLVLRPMHGIAPRFPFL